MCSGYLVNGGGSTECASSKMIGPILVRELFKISLMNHVCGVCGGYLHIWNLA